MKILPTNSRRAFTVFELLLVSAVVLVLLAVLLPALAQPKRHRRSHVYCVNNLKQDGMAFRIWEGDNNDKYPMAVPVAQGGVEELVATGNVVACFQVMSNELSTPKILYCPDDTEHVCATNFGGALTRSNISYFVGKDAAESEPGSVMMGDANLLWRGRSAAGILDLRKGAASWTKNRHNGGGYVLLADGSVQRETSIGLPGSSATTFFATNQIVVP